MIANGPRGADVSKNHQLYSHCALIVHELSANIESEQREYSDNACFSAGRIVV